MYHYTYLLHNGSQFYIGVRSSKVEPSLDYNYLGSSTDQEFCKTIKSKTILRTFKTRKEASLHEVQLHEFHDVGVNPRFANRAKATINGFCRQGISHLETTKNKISASNRGKEFSEKHKERLSVAQKARKPFSAETRKKMSSSHKGKKNTKEATLKQALAISGLKHCQADHAVYHFINKNGLQFIGKRIEFQNKFEISNKTNFRSLFAKKPKIYSYKGWRVACPI